jgi:porphobilinogen deaminase
MIRIGTRGSALALVQTRAVAAALEKAGNEVELVAITTEGDTSKASLVTLGGTGVFASALREALLDGRVDAVVHSLKDLPTAPHPGLVIAAIPRREDARDALCSRDGLTLDALPAGSRVGTGSPRRRAQLRARRADLEIVDIRGNVDTRLGRVGSGAADPQDSAVLVVWMRSPNSSASTAGRPHRARVPSRSKFAPARSLSSAPSTTVRPERPSRPSAKCWPCSRRDAPRPSARTP